MPSSGWHVLVFMVKFVGMILFSSVKKISVIIGILAVGITPVFAQTEGDFWTEATGTVDATLTTTTTSELVDLPAVPSRILIPEPIVRVGLYKTNEVIKIKSDFNYEIWIGGVVRGVLAPGETVTLQYKKGIYTVQTPSFEFGSKEYVRLVPQDPSHFFTLINYNRSVAGRKNVNFNVYRGTLEYRFSLKSNLPYIINELPLDLYTSGIAETSDSAPVEYMKALSVAARSYAYALISKTPPTEKRMFDVYATTADQLYLGYNSENFMPEYFKAAKATAGELVTYNTNPVITFYFSHSNGTTKSGGKGRPWLKSVAAPYDKGKGMLGHGIGMSNYDAQQHARRDGWDYKKILEYYYSNTVVEKIY